jgi:hypothetical protein
MHDDPSPVDDWLRIHRLLMDKETAFTDLALRAAAGEVSLEELDEQRQELMALRELCNAVYKRTFPPAGARSGRGADSVLPHVLHMEQEKAGEAPNESSQASSAEGKASGEMPPRRN